jgi:catabolite regulation protein CreA
MSHHIPRPSRWSGTIAVLALVASAGAASAQTYSADQQRLCTSDAMRLCSSEIPDVERVTVCMRRQKTSLSDGCRSVFEKPVVSSISSRTRQQD